MQYLYTQNHYTLFMLRPLAYRYYSLGLSLLLLLLMGYSCQSQAHDDPDEETTEIAPFVTPVEVISLQAQDFALELISNGKLQALQQSKLVFRLSEVLQTLHVVNGQAVKAGELLGSLCQENLQRRISQAQLRYRQTTMDLEDILLGHGYNLADSLRVPAQIWQMAGIRSGYLQARNDLKALEADLDQTRIRAPFAGVVAGLQARLHQQAHAGEVFCSLIDHSTFEVSFSIMENELPLLSLGQAVSIEPFSMPGKTWPGKINTINPQVNQHGQIQITALLHNTGPLLEGMNVKVKVQKPLHQQLVVPREAVLYRDNLNVLFKYVQGKAEWTYVNILHENSTHFSVTANPDRVASLQAGDTVVVSGNMNLAHGALISIP